MSENSTVAVVEAHVSTPIEKVLLDESYHMVTVDQQRDGEPRRGGRRRISRRDHRRGGARSGRGTVRREEHVEVRALGAGVGDRERSVREEVGFR